MLTQEKLAEIAANPSLPSPPPVALRVLEKVGRPDCSMSELAGLLQMDPVLSCHLLKTVNSALFSLSRPVSNIDRALALLGIKSVRSMVLALSLTSLQRRADQGRNLESFWRTSVLGAIFVRELSCKLKRPDPEGDLLAGLLRDLGSLILMQVYPKEHGEIMALPLSVLAEHQCEREAAAFGVDHAEVGAFMLNAWHVPPDITEAIRCHHRPDQAADEQQDRAHLLYLATQFSYLHVAPGHLGLQHEVLHLAREWFGIDESQFASAIRPIEEKCEVLARLLDVEIGKIHDQSTIVLGAIGELTQLVSEGSAENLTVRHEKEQVRREKVSWQRKARRLQREILRDPLTLAYNRPFFEDALACELKRANLRGSTMGLMFIDVDNFKSINDGFGHPFGDRVLKEISGVLRREVRAGDLVSRFGGDEFCVIVPGTSDQSIRALGNRLLQRLKDLTVEDGQRSVQTSVSIGAVLCERPSSACAPNQVLEAADQAMYQAKNSGKNQLAVTLFEPAQETISFPQVDAATFEQQNRSAACGSA